MSFFNTGIEALWSQDGTSAYLRMVITWRSDVYHQLEVDYADIEDRKILGIGAFVTSFFETPFYTYLVNSKT
jgi:hypothetical protein